MPQLNISSLLDHISKRTNSFCLALNQSEFYYFPNVFQAVKYFILKRILSDIYLVNSIHEITYLATFSGSFKLSSFMKDDLDQLMSQMTNLGFENDLELDLFISNEDNLHKICHGNHELYLTNENHSQEFVRILKEIIFSEMTLNEDPSYIILNISQSLSILGDELWIGHYYIDDANDQLSFNFYRFTDYNSLNNNFFLKDYLEMIIMEIIEEFGTYEINSVISIFRDKYLKISIDQEFKMSIGSSNILYFPNLDTLQGFYKFLEGYCSRLCLE